MTFSVITLPEAEAQIDEAFGWWAEHRSLEQALRWFDGMWAAIHSLNDRPDQWPLARENGEFDFDVREYHFGLGTTPTHRIIFTIRDDSVFVLAVWHTSREDLRREDISFGE